MTPDKAERLIEIAKAALMEYGRPDLAQQITRRGNRAMIPIVPIGSDEEVAYHKASQIVRHSQGLATPCLSCWRDYHRHVISEWPSDCEHR